jgi:calcineurin-like phosphoesterase family protein
MKPDDLLIFLGDLCDGEVEKKDAISAFISKIPCTKILVRGNNDLFSDTWYTQHGFKYVTPKFIWDNILFSHRPSDNNNRMNMHGHMHNSKTYYNSEISQFTNQIDVAYLGGRTKPVDLYEVIGKQPEYASVAKFFDHPYVSKKKR